MIDSCDEINNLLYSSLPPRFFLPLSPFQNPSLGGASSREKSKSKERVGSGLGSGGNGGGSLIGGASGGLITPDKSASKSPLIGKKDAKKEEKDAVACCGVTAIKARRESQRQTAAGNLKDARHHAERAKLCAGITFFVGAAILLISVGFFLTH